MFKYISQGSTIGICSPAWIPVPGKIINGTKYLEDRGFKLKFGTNYLKEYGYFAGTENERIDDLHQLYADEEVSAILATRGGWGTLRLLDRIDYDLIKNNPKPLIGYSDLTTLQSAIFKMTGLGSLSGPMLAVEMGGGIVDFTEKHFWGYIHNTDEKYKVDLSETSATSLVSGKASGLLMGGCLSLISHLLGTPYAPDYSNSILFLEDVGEQSYKIDRYFAHLKQAGIFNNIKGLILGEFLDCEPPESSNLFTVQYLIEEYFSNAPYPVLYNFPYGHGTLKITMPIGALTFFDTNKLEIVFENLFTG